MCVESVCQSVSVGQHSTPLHLVAGSTCTWQNGAIGNECSQPKAIQGSTQCLLILHLHSSHHTPINQSTAVGTVLLKQHSQHSRRTDSTWARSAAALMLLNSRLVRTNSGTDSRRTVAAALPMIVRPRAGKAMVNLQSNTQNTSHKSFRIVCLLQ